MSQSKRKFFSGSTIEQAVIAAASEYGLPPSEMAYRRVEKKHGFLNNRKRVVIEIDPEAPRIAEGDEAAPLPPVPVGRPRDAGFKRISRSGGDGGDDEKTKAKPAAGKAAGEERRSRRPADEPAKPRRERTERKVKDSKDASGEGDERDGERTDERAARPGRTDSRASGRGASAREPDGREAGDREASGREPSGRGASRSETSGRGSGDRGSSRRDAEPARESHAEDRPRGDRPRRGRPAEDRQPREKRPSEDRPSEDRPSEQPRGRGRRRDGEAPRAPEASSRDERKPALEERPARGRDSSAPRGRSDEAAPERGRSSGATRPPAKRSDARSPGRSSDDRPTGGRPSGDRPSGDRPTGDRPSSDRPTGGRPSGGGPSRGRSSGDLSERRVVDPSMDLLDAAEDAVDKLLAVTGLELDFMVELEGDRLEVDLEGPDAELLRENQGKSLFALELLIPILVRGLCGQQIFCQVDSEGFRAGREEELRKMALKMAEDVAESGDEKTLDYLNPAERRIVHMALADHEDVETESEGRGYLKRLTIWPL